METACIAVTSGGREVRSRQNKLIENEALAEVQLAAFPWEFPPPLPPSLENERGTRVLRNPRGSLDERASKPLVRPPLREGSVWITDGRAEKQCYPLREAATRPSENRVIRSYPFDYERDGKGKGCSSSPYFSTPRSLWPRIFHCLDRVATLVGTRLEDRRKGGGGIIETSRIEISRIFHREEEWVRERRLSSPPLPPSKNPFSFLAKDK